MILAKNIHKFYENNHILKGINLNIDEGEIVSLVGASGAGKTTLLQILGTIDSYDINSKAQLVLKNQDLHGMLSGLRDISDKCGRSVKFSTMINNEKTEERS